MAKKGGLGKGLDAIFYDNARGDEGGAVELSINELEPNRNQPRKSFNDEAMSELADSIAQHGVLQPLLVRPLLSGGYQIVAGERRWRASRMAGLTTVPALIRELDDEKIMELALIENVQRDDLTPIEEARAYEILQTKFGYTQERLAERMGKSRSAIANITRLLALPEDVQQMVQEGKLTTGHVRPMLSINIPEWQSAFAREVYQDKLSVREVEKMVKSAMDEGKVSWSDETILFQKKAKYKKLPAELRNLQDQLAERLSTKVSIKKNRDGSGKLVLEYYSEEDLVRIFDALKGEFY